MCNEQVTKRSECPPHTSKDVGSIHDKAWNLYLLEVKLKIKKKHPNTQAFMFQSRITVLQHQPKCNNGSHFLEIFTQTHLIEVN